MGWNTFGSDINENLIPESADAMVSTGLKGAGNETFVHDRMREGAILVAKIPFDRPQSVLVNDAAVRASGALGQNTDLYQLYCCFFVFLI